VIILLKNEAVRFLVSPMKLLNKVKVDYFSTLTSKIILIK